MKRSYVPFPKCELCGYAHPEPGLLWRCLNDDCGKVVCAWWAMPGKRYGRPGQRVHARVEERVNKHGNKFAVQTLCGVLEPYQLPPQTPQEGPKPAAGEAIAPDPTV